MFFGKILSPDTIISGINFTHQHEFDFVTLTNIKDTRNRYTYSINPPTKNDVGSGSECLTRRKLETPPGTDRNLSYQYHGIATRIASFH